LYQALRVLGGREGVVTVLESDGPFGGWDIQVLFPETAETVEQQFTSQALTSILRALGEEMPPGVGMPSDLASSVVKVVDRLTMDAESGRLDVDVSAIPDAEPRPRTPTVTPIPTGRQSRAAKLQAERENAKLEARRRANVETKTKEKSLAIARYYEEYKQYAQLKAQARKQKIEQAKVEKREKTLLTYRGREEQLRREREVEAKRQENISLKYQHWVQQVAAQIRQKPAASVHPTAEQKASRARQWAAERHKARLAQQEKQKHLDELDLQRNANIEAKEERCLQWEEAYLARLQAEKAALAAAAEAKAQRRLEELAKRRVGPRITAPRGPTIAEVGEQDRAILYASRLENLERLLRCRVQKLEKGTEQRRVSQLSPEEVLAQQERQAAKEKREHLQRKRDLAIAERETKRAERELEQQLASEKKREERRILKQQEEERREIEVAKRAEERARLEAEHASQEGMEPRESGADADTASHEALRPGAAATEPPDAQAQAAQLDQPDSSEHPGGPPGAQPDGDMPAAAAPDVAAPDAPVPDGAPST
jgi:hypothetical protein